VNHFPSDRRERSTGSPNSRRHLAAAVRRRLSSIAQRDRVVADALTGGNAGSPCSLTDCRRCAAARVWARMPPGSVSL
jgi:hypothetical protein